MTWQPTRGGAPSEFEDALYSSDEDGDVAAYEQIDDDDDISDVRQFYYSEFRTY